MENFDPDECTRCETTLNELEINDRKSAMKWIAKNHPDKLLDISDEDKITVTNKFQETSNCIDIKGLRNPGQTSLCEERRLEMERMASMPPTPPPMPPTPSPVYTTRSFTPNWVPSGRRKSKYFSEPGFIGSETKPELPKKSPKKPSPVWKHTGKPYSSRDNKVGGKRSKNRSRSRRNKRSRRNRK